MKKRYALLIILLTVVAISCNDNGNDPEALELSTVYVTNEGNFSDSDGSLTSYNPGTKEPLQKAFEEINGRPLAGIIQSAEIIGDQMFIVLNNADKIEVVNTESFESEATIQLSKTPTSIVSAGDTKAYVTNLFDGNVTVIDLENYEETDQTIAVGDNPFDAVRVDNRVYVANSGYGNDNTVSVINTQNDTVEETISVGAGPVQIVADSGGRLWVVCDGLIAYDEEYNRQPENDKPGSIYILDAENGSVIDSIESSEIEPMGIPPAKRLTVNEDEAVAYYMRKDRVSVIDLNSYSIKVDNFVSRGFYGVGYFPLQDLLYAAQNKGYTQSGQTVLYNTEGTAVDSFATGKAPNGFYFIEE